MDKYEIEWHEILIDDIVKDTINELLKRSEIDDKNLAIKNPNLIMDFRKSLEWFGDDFWTSLVSIKIQEMVRMSKYNIIISDICNLAEHTFVTRILRSPMFLIKQVGGTNTHNSYNPTNEDLFGCITFQEYAELPELIERLVADYLDKVTTYEETMAEVIEKAGIKLDVDGEITNEMEIVYEPEPMDKDTASTIYG